MQVAHFDKIDRKRDEFLVKINQLNNSILSDDKMGKFKRNHAKIQIAKDEEMHQKHDQERRRI